MKFNVGDVVVWNHILGSIHGAGSIIKRSAVPNDPLGTVVEVANVEETWFKVDFEDSSSMVLTEDELIKVEV